MGQKVNPVGLRVGVNRDWDSKWYASDKEFATFLHEDIKVREYLEKEVKDAALSTVEIQRVKDKVEVNLNVARPGVVVGQDGKRVEEISKQVKKICHGKDVKINVVEVKNPDLDAKLVAQSIAAQLEARASFRTVQKKAIQRVMKAGAKGIKTSVSGRLAGADIARSEGYSEGVVPLHTLRADIDYATAEAHTTYGRLGVKVWICRGEILPTRKPRNSEKGE
jgi:small subunit ribosomal protein S3